MPGKPAAAPAMRGGWLASLRAGLLAGLSARSQRQGRFFPLGGHRDHIRQVNRQGACDAVENVDGRVVLAAFYAADRRAIDVCINGKILLRDALRGAYAPKIPCQSRPSIHGAHATNLRWCNPLDISDILLPNPT